MTGAGERDGGAVAWAADDGVFDLLHGTLDAVWAAHPEVGHADRMAVALALSELVANAVEHGAASRVWLSVEVEGGEVAVRLEDDGVPTPRRVDSAVVPDDPMAESGRGMALARVVAELSHAWVEGRNRWEVRPRRP